MQWSILNKLNGLKNNTIKLWLYLICKLTKADLQLNFISAPDPLVISGNYFNIYWNVQGCYKITINDKIELPGNISLADLHSNLAKDTLAIKFYGIHTTIEKTIGVNVVKIMLSRDLYFENKKEYAEFYTAIKVPNPHVLKKLNYKNFYRPIVPAALSWKVDTFFSAFKNI